MMRCLTRGIRLKYFETRDNVDSSYKIVDLKVNGLLVTPNIITDLWVATDLSKIETK